MVVISAICVPLILLPKPLIIRKQMLEHEAHGHHNHGEDKHAIPMQEQKVDDQKGLLDNAQNREQVVQ